MALTYQKVIGVISQSPDMRKDFEVNNLLPWFRKKSDLFRTLKTELLFDIIKNLQFVKKNQDDLIIRQADQGDCMYILLSGKVTIYILYNKTGDADDETPVQPVVNKSESLRQQLGTFVTHLGDGATFGEVALMSDDCIRTASIIADQQCELIVIDRDLYNRSVKNVLKQEFEDKSNFIANSPYFRGWPPKYKKQLAMALQKESLPYEGVLTKQGEPVEAIHFILTGEIKVLMDPSSHANQYPKLFETNEDVFNQSQKKVVEEDEDEDDEVKDLMRQMSGGKMKDKQQQDPTMKFRKKVKKKQANEVCLLGVNESLGDMEVFLDLETYMQTAVCSQKTEVLILELKHFERLLVKRNPRTIESMKGNLEIRIQSRMSRHLEKSIPLLRILLTKSEEYNEIRQQQIEARMTAVVEKPVKQTRNMSDTFESFVPPQGALIDIYGPGTVFYRIRQREEAKALRAKKGRNLFGGFQGASGAQRPGDPSPGSARRLPNHLAHQSVDHQTSDPVLTNLENRMKRWLDNDSNKRADATRVVKLPRSQTELDHEIKPGAKVVLRPSGFPMSSSQDDSDDMDHIHHGHSWENKTET